jgi:aldehyde dehydrogenase (NAD+)
LLPAWKLAAALAAGCPVVLKPAPESPLTALRLAEILDQAEVPAGVVNVLPGGDEVGAALVRHPLLAKVAFTGEVVSGRKVLAAAAEQIKRVSVELGGKSALVVFEDYDLDQAVAQTLFGAYFNSGQVCQAVSRIFVQDTIYAAFVDRLVERVKRLVVGDAVDPAIDLGPVVSVQRLEAVNRMVEEAVRAGANLRAGGYRLPGKGYFYAPTVLTEVTSEMPIAQTEIFGPVSTVFSFHTEAEALQLAESTHYGLAQGVLTHDIRRALSFAREVEAGTVWVNTVQVLSPTVPFGGFKQSGIGRELGFEGLEGYLETKTVIVDLNQEPMQYF